ncbi:hypothetical protein AYL99_08283 [Fonsecaea erecta]|uniref:PLD phosphodiesterase domain-containing protein n=1 Tax=Fonsecaea erecta TaxID=1367422 RepID=A0A178ZER0_9EURO|nr:hypothetical protein AYL99_08283 [Fonsecaea erecta]OAP57545.1 hypothetical protein AYL99_08283 [Fonsecaea erecta]
MPPEIVDLISDDETDDGYLERSSHPLSTTGETATPTSRHGKTRDDANKRNVARRSSPEDLSETFEPGTGSWDFARDLANFRRVNSRSSTFSSRTEGGSPLANLGEEPSRRRSTTTARRDHHGKGKQREINIPEIDLSQPGPDGDDEHDDNDDGDVVFVSDNGGLSEDEAMKRAIALSLQEETPPRRQSREGAGTGTAAFSSSSTSASKAKAPSKPQASPRPLEGTATAAAGPTARRADEAMPDVRDSHHATSLSPTPLQPPVPQSLHATTTKGPLPSPGSTPTPPPPPPHQPASADQARPDTTTNTSTSVPAFSLASLDRRAMEAERLARQKRKLDEAGSRDAGDPGDDGRSAKAVKVNQSATASASASASRNGAGTAEKPSSQQQQQHSTFDLHRGSSGSAGSKLQLPERKNRETTEAVQSSKPGQHTGAAMPASSPSGKVGSSGNKKGDVESRSTNATASNPSPANPPCILINDDEDEDDPNDNKNTSTRRKDTTGSSSSSFSSIVGNSNSSTANLYPDGIALKTYVAGHSSAGTITFEKVVSPSSQLESCLLSSFIWNLDWLLPHFETRRTKFQLVMHAKDTREREAVQRDFQGVPNVRLTFPPMGGNISCMHSKLMLLFYKDHEEFGSAMGKKGPIGGPRCRIVVPTANLVDFDWGVGGFMENTVWLIDLPPKAASDAANSSSAHGATTTAAPPAAGRQTSFEKSLKEFLRAQTVPEDVIRKLDLFDFGKTERYGFVHSIGGVHGGQAWQTTGVCGLGRTVTELGLASRGPIRMDYVSSSIGSLNDEFLRSIHLAASGDNGLTEYNRRVDKRGPVKQGSWKENFRFYFPSDQTVRTSKGGPSSAGTVCFNIAWWNNPNFPRSNMYDCVSVREGLLMHNKLLFVRYTSSVEKSQQGNVGWVYVGSANLSESAWGRLVQDRTTKKPRLNCRNWECGVIIPVPAMKGNSDSFSVMDRGSAGLALFNHIVPVPMRLPSENLENQRPWTFSD